MKIMNLKAIIMYYTIVDNIKIKYNISKKYYL